MFKWGIVWDHLYAGIKSLLKVFDLFIKLTQIHLDFYYIAAFLHIFIENEDSTFRN